MAYPDTLIRIRVPATTLAPALRPLIWNSAAVRQQLESRARTTAGIYKINLVTSWGDKYAWHYWRPGDAIRQASTDGNAATIEDPTWSPRNGVCTNPSVASCAVFGGTPEHTSGTSMFAGAAAEILASFYCSGDVPFAFTGEQPGSAARSYKGFAQAAREAGRSRIYGGIHFQFSNDAGREAGKAIAREIVRARLVAGHTAGASTVCKPNRLA